MCFYTILNFVFTCPALPRPSRPGCAARARPRRRRRHGLSRKQQDRGPRTEEKAQREANKKIGEAATEGQAGLPGHAIACCCWVLENLQKHHCEANEDPAC